MTNFDFLTSDQQFNTFSSVAVSAEKILSIDPSACVLNCRRAMEFAVKWMYSVDSSLSVPYDDRLVCLMDNTDFRDIVGSDIWRRMKLIRTLGNDAAHSGKKISKDSAALCLENLFVFLDFVAYCYSADYEEHKFDRTLLDNHSVNPAETAKQTGEALKEAEVKLEQLMAENAALPAVPNSSRLMCPSR